MTELARRREANTERCSIFYEMCRKRDDPGGGMLDIKESLRLDDENWSCFPWLGTTLWIQVREPNFPPPRHLGRAQ